MAIHRILVSKIGPVYTGDDEFEACAVFGEYVALSMSGDDTVVVYLIDDEVECVHHPEGEPVDLAWAKLPPVSS